MSDESAFARLPRMVKVHRLVEEVKMLGKNIETFDDKPTGQALQRLAQAVETLAAEVEESESEEFARKTFEEMDPGT